LRLGGFVRRDGKTVSAIVTGSVSFDAHDLARYTGVAGQIAEGTTEGRTFTLSGELRANVIDLKSDSVKLTPFVRGRWQDTTIDAYAESGAVALDRLVQDVTVNPAALDIGADFGGSSDNVRYGIEAVWTEGLENDAQTISTALVTVPDVPAIISTDGTDDSYARLSGFIGFGITDTMMISLAATSSLAQDDSENLSGFLRLSGKF